mgnify:CR=1 FL=1
MIPDYQTLMLPLLNVMSNKKEYTLQQLITQLQSEFNLSAEELELKLNSGTQTVFENRVGWAKSYLKNAGLIDTPKRGIHIISMRGIQVLASKPEKIDNTYLMRFPEFVEFKKRNQPAEEKETPVTPTVSQTPDEVLDSVYFEFRKNLATELLRKTMQCSPSFFERLVVELLVAMGYGGSLRDAGRSVGRSGDEGIDGIIKEDRLGLDVIYIQAKRWSADQTIGRPEVQKFVGALVGKGAKKGVFITTARFSADAVTFEKQTDLKIVLIDGAQLADLMIDYNIGCMHKRSYDIKSIDSDYFVES